MVDGVQHIDHDERLETGPVKFGEDWTGVFIRGDEARLYAHWIGHVLATRKLTVIERGVLEGLIDVLRSSDERNR